MSHAVAPLEMSEVREVWPAFLKKVGMRLAIPLGIFHTELTDRLTIVAPATLVLAIPADYNHIAEVVDTRESRSRIEETLSILLRARWSSVWNVPPSVRRMRLRRRRP